MRSALSSRQNHKQLKGTHLDLQSEGQADEVHHHFLVGQLHAEKAQKCKEGLVVLLSAGLLLTVQVDVSIQLLSVLENTQK